MTSRILGYTCALAALLLAAPAALGQEAPKPTTTAPANGQPGETAPPAAAQGTDQPAEAAPVPPVEVIQEQAKPKPAPVYVEEAPPPKPRKKAAAPKPNPAPKPQPAPVAEPAPDFAEPAPPVEAEAPAVGTRNPVFGAANSQGAAARAEQSATSPVNPTQLVPSSLAGFSSAATRVDPAALAERRSPHLNDALKHVPGVSITNDDGAAHHGGIGLRGSPPRRSRKVLVMEDGHPNNLALWLDPSVHYFVPLDRIEEFEVLRGTVITHGPNNNFGVINARNLSPFGKAETVISSSVGITENDTGTYVDEDGEAHTGTNDKDFSSRWHMHTRQMVNNVGLVFSYTGENVQGTWDTERLRAHDFYGALGFKGQSSDLTVAMSYVRQRDTYDENNLEGEEEDEGGEPGEPEENFFNLKHCHTCFAPGSIYNNYNGEIWRGRITHNAYLDQDTTLTSRVYAQHHRRDRYQIVTAEDNPGDTEEGGIRAEFEEGDDDLFDVVLGEDSMFGRLRTFRHIGLEERLELANRQFIGGMKQDIQVGARYEYQDMTNRNFIGESGEVLKDGDEEGLTIFDRNLQANAVSAYMQTNIHVTSDFNVIPGVRFEYYSVKRKSKVTAEEEGEAEEGEEDECEEAIGEDECLVIEGINRNPFNDSFEQFHTLPGIAFSYTGFLRTTVFGGYHRGMTTGVLRNEDFPVEDEIGDNFQLGFRTAAIKGLQLEVTGFHQRLHDFQFGASFSSAGDRSFGKAEEVHINGVELAARVDSHPHVGGPLNLFGVGVYTYNEAMIEKGVAIDEEGETVDFSGNRVPEVPFETAALTLGVESKTGWRWDLSATWTYRGEFFTDEFNTPYGDDPEGENGLVPEVWLLSARFNLDIADTGATVWLSGDNLLDELYISDREDGLKPGQGRTFWAGFKYKFN